MALVGRKLFVVAALSSTAVLAVAPTILTFSDTSPSYIVNTPIIPNTPDVTGAVTGYTCFPHLPNGVKLDPETGMISGIPTSAAPPATYEIVATNHEEKSAPFQLKLEVYDVAPQLDGYTSPADYIVGQKIIANSPLLTAGTSVKFTVSPDLPLGLTLDRHTGDLSGKPAKAAEPSTYTISVENTFPHKSRYNLSITVHGPPELKGYKESECLYETSITIPANTPNVEGTVDMYTVTPDLPNGLTIGGESGVITGAPIAKVDEAEYKIRAMNQYGSDTFDVKIKVQDPDTSCFPGESIAVIENHGARKVSELDAGDRILGDGLVFQPILGFLHVDFANADDEPISHVRRPVSGNIFC